MAEMQLTRVELHIHLDGAVRHETLLDLARQKGVEWGKESEETIRKRFVHEKPCACLGDFLAPFIEYMPVICGDPDAIERIAYELCETQAKNGVLYFEARYCPHFKSNTVQHNTPVQLYREKGDVTPEDVVRCVNRGFSRGETDFGIKARSILCCIRTHPAWGMEMVELCDKFRNEGVVAIDIAGSPHGYGEQPQEHDIQVFEEAKRRGIRRTVHAGEAGTAEDVRDSIAKLHAERIGHGYHVVDDAKCYEFAKKSGVHFECCPLSSRLTNSVTCPWEDHPIAQFMKDKVNFGISTDDPTVTGFYLNQEMDYVKENLRFTDAQIAQLQVNAAKAAFLPESEKQELISQIKKANNL